MSGAAAIAALPPPTAPPAGPVGAREPEASPLTVSTCSNACLGQEVQRKAGLMRTFRSGGCDPRWEADVERQIRPMPKDLKEVAESPGRIGRGRVTSSGRSTSAGRPPFSPHLARPRRPPIQSRNCVMLSTWSSYRPLGKASSSRLNSGSQSASLGMRTMPRSILSVWTANRVSLSSRGVYSSSRPSRSLRNSWQSG